MNWNDHKDDKYSMYLLGCEPRHFVRVNDFYCYDEFDEINNSHESDEANNNDEKIDPKMFE